MCVAYAALKTYAENDKKYRASAFHVHLDEFLGARLSCDTEVSQLRLAALAPPTIGILKTFNMMGFRDALATELIKGDHAVAADVLTFLTLDMAASSPGQIVVKWKSIPLCSMYEVDHDTRGVTRMVNVPLWSTFAGVPVLFSMYDSVKKGGAAPRLMSEVFANTLPLAASRDDGTLSRAEIMATEIRNVCLDVAVVFVPPFHSKSSSGKAQHCKSPQCCDKLKAALACKAAQLKSDLFKQDVAAGKSDRQSPPIIPGIVMLMRTLMKWANMCPSLMGLHKTEISSSVGIGLSELSPEGVLMPASTKAQFGLDQFVHTMHGWARTYPTGRDASLFWDALHSKVDLSAMKGAAEVVEHVLRTVAQVGARISDDEICDVRKGLLSGLLQAILGSAACGLRDTLSALDTLVPEGVLTDDSVAAIEAIPYVLQAIERYLSDQSMVKECDDAFAPSVGGRKWHLPHTMLQTQAAPELAKGGKHAKARRRVK